MECTVDGTVCNLKLKSRVLNNHRAQEITKRTLRECTAYAVILKSNNSAIHKQGAQIINLETTYADIMNFPRRHKSNLLISGRLLFDLIMT